jgi:AP-3 complex subunit mu
MEVPSDDKTLYLFSILRYGLSYLAVCPAEVSPLLVLEFLHRVADIFSDYFGTPTDESAIKDNFSTVYQLLEEMVDYGWPLTTEPNALKAMIRPPTVMGKIQSVVTGGSNAIVSEALPSGTVSNMPWRAAGVRYSQNEIYIDIVEEIDAIMDANGNVVSSDVSGSIQAQSHLMAFQTFC